MGGGNAGNTGTRMRAQARAQNSIAEQMRGMATAPALSSIAAGEFTPYEQQYYNQALSAVDLGQVGAERNIEQTVREGAASRGLFSSRGAISEEAMGMANIPLQIAQQRAGIYGQQANMSRQGVLQGTAMQQGLLGGSSNIYSQSAQTRAGAAELDQQAQQGVMNSVMGAGALIAAPFTGGASLAAYGASQQMQGGGKGYGVNLNQSYAQQYQPQQIGMGGQYIGGW